MVLNKGPSKYNKNKNKNWCLVVVPYNHVIYKEGVSIASELEQICALLLTSSRKKYSQVIIHAFTSLTKTCGGPHSKSYKTIP